MGSERVDGRDVRRVPATRDHDPADPRHVVARIERPPRPVEEHLDPGAEVHRIDHRHADVTEVFDAGAQILRGETRGRLVVTVA